MIRHPTPPKWGYRESVTPCTLGVAGGWLSGRHPPAPTTRGGNPWPVQPATPKPSTHPPGTRHSAWTAPCASWTPRSSIPEPGTRTPFATHGAPEGYRTPLRREHSASLAWTNCRILTPDAWLRAVVRGWAMGLSRRPRRFPCMDCGCEVFKRWHYDRPNLCIECATRRMLSAVSALQEGGGRAYDRWAKSNGPAGRPPGRKNVGK